MSTRILQQLSEWQSQFAGSKYIWIGFVVLSMYHIIVRRRYRRLADVMYPRPKRHKRTLLQKTWGSLRCWLACSDDRYYGRRGSGHQTHTIRQSIYKEGEWKGRIDYCERCANVFGFDDGDMYKLDILPIKSANRITKERTLDARIKELKEEYPEIKES